MIRWYDVVPKSLKTQYWNPLFKRHGISVPFRALMVGNSGSGKTQCLLQLIYEMDDTFGHITICCANSDEPLYRYLATKIKPELLSIVEGYENIPLLEDLDPEVQHLVVWDDLVLTKDQSLIEEYFIRGRKIAKGVSMVYLTQSYWAVPKTIRLQVSYIFLKKVSCTRDLTMIMKDFSLGLQRQELLELYKHCTEDPQSFLLVDIAAPSERRFRKNFDEILHINDGEESGQGSSGHEERQDGEDAPKRRGRKGQR